MPRKKPLAVMVKLSRPSPGLRQRASRTRRRAGTGTAARGPEGQEIMLPGEDRRSFSRAQTPGAGRATRPAAGLRGSAPAG
jgi:hypothetical protein